MVDRTAYAPDKVPDLALRQIFERQRLDPGLCKLMADSKLLTVDMFAMLGESISAVKRTLQALIPDSTKFGPDEPSVELALTSLAAVWKTCSVMQEQFATRRAKMEEDPGKVPEIPGDDHAEFREQFVARHPDVLLPHHREPHRKFVERVQRDYMVHGALPFYEVGEIRTRSETLVQKSGLSKNAEDLLKVVTVDQPVAAASESQVMDKLHAFFVTLEYLNICDFSLAHGPLKYLELLEEWRHEHRGLALLLTVDSLIRKKVAKLMSDHRKTYTTFSKALLEVLDNHKQLWNDARSSAELEKFKQAGHSASPVTPPRGSKRERSPSDQPTPKKTARAKKNKARRERHKEIVRKAKEGNQETDRRRDPPKTKLVKDSRIPAQEWQSITSFKYSGKRRCPWFNCSLGCRFGEACKNDHLCVECGKPHAWHGNH